MRFSDFLKHSERVSIENSNFFHYNKASSTRKQTEATCTWTIRCWRWISDSASRWFLTSEWALCPAPIVPISETDSAIRLYKNSLDTLSGPDVDTRLTNIRLGDIRIWKSLSYVRHRWSLVIPPEIQIFDDFNNLTWLTFLAFSGVWASWARIDLILLQCYGPLTTDRYTVIRSFFLFRYCHISFLMDLSEYSILYCANFSLRFFNRYEQRDCLLALNKILTLTSFNIFSISILL